MSVDNQNIKVQKKEKYMTYIISQKRGYAAFVHLSYVENLTNTRISIQYVQYG